MRKFQTGAAAFGMFLLFSFVIGGIFIADQDRKNRLAEEEVVEEVVDENEEVIVDGEVTTEGEVDEEVIDTEDVTDVATEQ